MKKIAIASGKGGTGKTFLTTNLYKVMERAGLSVTVVDCDAEVPNASLFIQAKPVEVKDTLVFCPEIDKKKCTYCNQCALYCHFHAITCIPKAKFIKLMPDLCHACKACMYACSSGAIMPSFKKVGQVTSYADDKHILLVEARIKEGEHSPVPVIRQAIAIGESNQSEYLLLDAPPGCSCPFVNTVMDADEVILITEPTPFGLSDLKHSIQVLRELRKPFSVVINRSNLGDDKLHDYLKSEQINILAEIPYAEQVAMNYSIGNFIVEQDKAFYEVFTKIMKQIV